MYNVQCNSSCVRDLVFLNFVIFTHCNIFAVESGCWARCSKMHLVTDVWVYTVTLFLLFVYQSASINFYIQSVFI